MPSPDERSATAALARLEGRRLIAGPAFLTGAGMAMVGTAIFLVGAGEPSATWSDDAWTMGAGFIMLAIFTMIATNRAALRDRREHTAEHHSSLPLPSWRRVHGLLLAIAWPMGVAATLLAAGTVAGAAMVDMPAVAIVHGVQLPLLVATLGALGVALARLLPSPFVAPMVALGLYVISPGDSTPSAWHAVWPFATPDDAAMAVWHLVYLTGLAAVLATAALIPSGWRRGFATAGVIGIALTTVALAVMLSRACPGACLL